MAKSNKIEKNWRTDIGYQEAECLWNMLSPRTKTETYGKGMVMKPIALSLWKKYLNIASLLLQYCKMLW